ASRSAPVTSPISPAPSSRWFRPVGGCCTSRAVTISTPWPTRSAPSSRRSSTTAVFDRRHRPTAPGGLMWSSGHWRCVSCWPTLCSAVIDRAEVIEVRSRSGEAVVPARMQVVLDEIRPLADAFAAADRPLYLVGGIVRDQLLGRELSPDADLDLTTPARPEEI